MNKKCTLISALLLALHLGFASGSYKTITYDTAGACILAKYDMNTGVQTTIKVLSSFGEAPDYPCFAFDQKDTLMFTISTENELYSINTSTGKEKKLVNPYGAWMWSLQYSATKDLLYGVTEDTSNGSIVLVSLNYKSGVFTKIRTLTEIVGTMDYLPTSFSDKNSKIVLVGEKVKDGNETLFLISTTDGSVSEITNPYNNTIFAFAFDDTDEKLYAITADADDNIVLVSIDYKANSFSKIKELSPMYDLINYPTTMYDKANKSIVLTNWDNDSTVTVNVGTGAMKKFIPANEYVACVAFDTTSTATTPTKPTTPTTQSKSVTQTQDVTVIKKGEYIYVENASPASIAITNVLGKEISRVTNDNKIAVAHIPQGLYFVTVVTGSKKLTTTFRVAR